MADWFGNSSGSRSSGGSGMDWIPSRSGSGVKKVAPIAAPQPMNTDPTTRASEKLITNSGPTGDGEGGTVDTENRAGGRKKRPRGTAFASQELLG